MRHKIRMALLVALVIFLATVKGCFCQSFTQIGSYPFVVTDLDFDSSGNIYVAKQDGAVYKNTSIILEIETWNQNEMGLVGFEVVNSNIYLHVSGYDSIQRIINYDTVTETFDTLLEVDYHLPFNTNHRGGDIVVSDSILLCSFGYGAASASSQDLEDYRGKLLSINLSTQEVGIIGFGLRNPFRFDIGFIGDVGSDICEEVNSFTLQDTLLNYGWPCFECDSQRLNPDTLCVYDYVWPVYSYEQSHPRAIIGGCLWQGNWYYTDQYTGRGGFVDSLNNHTPLNIPFPEFVTGMSVNPTVDMLVVSTWDGRIFIYNDIILAIPEDTIKPDVKYKRFSNDELPTIYTDILGRKYTYPPYDIIFYDPHIKKLRFINTLNERA